MVLAITTICYLRTTNKILAESRKSREAAEKQASAAQRSVTLLQEQLEQQLGLGRGIVQTAINSTIESISYWRERPLTNISAASGFPLPDDLIPANAQAAVDHARRISPEAAEILSSAFDDLRNAKKEIERVRILGVASLQTRGAAFLEQSPSKAPIFLESALNKLQKVKASLVDRSAK